MGRWSTNFCTCGCGNNRRSKCNKNYSDIKEITEEEATEKGLYNTIGEEIDNKYIEYLKSIALNKEIDKEYGKDIKIVYTPLHGTGKN